MFIYELSKQDLKLSKAEALLLGKIKRARSIDNCLFISKKIDYTRLAYTRKVWKVLFRCKEENLREMLQRYDFNRLYKGSFSLGTRHLPFRKELAGIIYRNLRNPVVNLKNAKTTFEIMKLDRVYVCLVLWENKEDFNSRKAHNRPELHPSSLDPRLARAMVNMASSEEILDPFCGSGGILIEAGLMGLKAVGSDIDRIMVNRARINMKHFRVGAELKKKDARNIKGRYPAIVTDPPYSKNTKDVELEMLYLDFLKNAEKLTSKIVISFPDSIGYKRIVGRTKWKITHHFSYYIHKSMAKQILVLTLVKARFPRAKHK